MNSYKQRMVAALAALTLVFVVGSVRPAPIYVGGAAAAGPIGEQVQPANYPEDGGGGGG